MQSEERLRVYSDCVNNPTSHNVLVSINSTTSVNYSSIAYQCPAPEFYARRLKSATNNSYSFSLTDDNGALIQLNGLNLNMTNCFIRRVQYIIR